MAKSSAVKNSTTEASFATILWWKTIQRLITLSLFSSIELLLIVIVNLIFLQRPQKRSCGNQLIHRRLSKT